MTICIGALAAGGKSIVCVADKAVTYGEDIQGEDTDSTKIVPVGRNGAHALISGDETSVGRVLSKIAVHDDIGKDVSATGAYLEAAYKQSESEILEATFLHPFLDISSFNNALLAMQINPIIATIAAQIDQARRELTKFSCGLLLCGFDSTGAPYILHLGSPGLVSNLTHTGFHAIGSGWDYALSRLLGVEWEREHSIDRVLYECFDSKVNAEKDPAVGYAWDAVILTKDRTESVPKKIKKLVDRAWIAHSRSPYEVFDLEEDFPLPPNDWKEQLSQYTERIMPSISRTSEDQP